jgi:LysM repeat protein
MRTISCWLATLALIAAFATRASAQESAVQQQLDQITGKLQDLSDAQASEGKRIDALEKKIADLGDKLNSPTGNNFASTDDLKKLAEQVQEIDKKRQADNEQIIKAIEKLGKGGSARIDTSENRKPIDTTANTSGADTTSTATTGGAGAQQNGYNYVIQKDNTLSAIAKAYQAKGIKVTVKEILAANPNLNPNALYVGQKIFIPAPQ